MAKSASNLASMTVDALLRLRDEIGATLNQKSRELQAQLQRLGVSGSARGRAGRSHPRKGMKVAPKYRGRMAKPGRGGVQRQSGSRH
jgi:hypothetical protein